ncbi:MAG: HIT family protein [Planctomycetota bacterium]
MFDGQSWARRLTGENCAACLLPAEGDDPLWVATLPSGRVRLQDDGDFRGYCILYFRRHVVELPDLTAAERGQLMEDLSRVADAIRQVCRPAKLNYACLGNEVPHLHWHIVPRYPEDGWWGRSFMVRPAEARRSLPKPEYESLRAALRAELA